MAAALSEESVKRCGEELLDEVLGDGFGGTAFLAGGAFRTLLTGVAPRDLDLWTPDAPGRAALIEHLLARGATLEGDHPPFQMVFRCGRHRVDVPYAGGTLRLVDRLATFDLGLSAIGVAQVRGRITEVAIDPCALRSVEERAVLLLRPLRNVSYLLNTVERARRYAFELGFELPREEEQLLWETYRALPPERQAKVLSNYAWAGGRDERIADHARHIGSGALPPTA